MFSNSIFSEMKLFLVGGHIRTQLIKNIWKMEDSETDYDFTTPLMPEEIKIIAEGNDLQFDMIQEDHLTCQVIFQGEKLEITTFRKESSCDGRHAVVEPTQHITLDLGRRDLTVNSIALEMTDNISSLEDVNIYLQEQINLVLEEKDHKFIDPFNGIEDIKNGVLNFVGHYSERIKEDWLRIIRLVRFSSIYGFEIRCWEEIKTFGLSNISSIRESLDTNRIKDETEKVFTRSSSPSMFFEYLDDLGLLNVYFPLLKRIKEELKYKSPQNKWHPEGNTWNHIMSSIDSTEKDAELRWMVLTHDLGKINTATKRKKDQFWGFLRHDQETHLIDEFFKSIYNHKKLIENCKFIMENHMSIAQIGKKHRWKVMLLVSEHGFELVHNLLSVHKADKIMCNENEFFGEFIDSITEEELVPKITGDILLKLGIPQGKIYRDIKRKALINQFKDPSKNIRTLVLEALNAVGYQWVAEVKQKFDDMI